MNHVDILLVEDSEADIRLVREAFRDAEAYDDLSVVRDGEAALSFLRGDEKTNPGGIVPGLILLDLYLPKLGGLEVLREIKSDLTLRGIPVIVMTTSREEEDAARAYDFQANSYIIKPVDFDQLTRVIESLENFWLSTAYLPRPNAAPESA